MEDGPCGPARADTGQPGRDSDRGPAADPGGPFDRLYPQESGESALQQLHAQLANPLPYDLDELDLSEYRDLAPQWQDWGKVRAACGRMAVAVFDHVCEGR